MNGQRPHSKLIRAGLWVWLLGCGPLFIDILLNLVGLGDDNAIGLGLLFIVALPIGLILVIVGAIRRWLTRD